MNAVDITPYSSGWAAAPGKCNDSGSCSGVKLKVRLSTRVLSDPTDRRLLSQGSSHAVPNNEQPIRADRLGRVYSLVDVSVTGVKVFLQILIGNRCSVDKATNSTCMLFAY